MFLYTVAQAFEENSIDYVIVGGFAVALHGAIRGTVDLDLVINLSEKDFINAERVLKFLGLEPRLPVDAKQVFAFREDYIKNRNLIAWSFYNPSRSIDTIDIIITHDRRKMKAKKIRFNGITLKVASISDLIQMKSESGRPQDLADIEALRKLQNETK
jgi:hypothetical protein